MARRGLPRCADLASTAIPPHHLPDQLDANGKMSAWRATTHSTLPVSSCAFDGLHSPTGSHSNGTEPLPPSITSTPLGLGSPRQWQTTSHESRHSIASIYTSPNFSLPGHPAVGPGNSYCCQPSWIPPHVEYLAHWHAHLWAILSPPDY